MGSFAVKLIGFLSFTPKALAAEEVAGAGEPDPAVTRKLAQLLAERGDLESRLKVIEQEIRTRLIEATDIDPERDPEAFAEASRVYLEAARRIVDSAPPPASADPTPPPADPVKVAITLARLRSLKTRLALYVAETGDRAVPLDSAAIEIPSAERRDGFGSTILIERAAGAEPRFTLRSSGPDRKPGTADDLVMEFQP